MDNLTSFQANLIKDIQQEFERLNPKIDTNKPFNLQTIKAIQNEEAAHIESVKLFNLRMIDIYAEQFRKEIKEFEDEFGSEIEVRYDFQIYPTSPNNTLEYFISQNKLKAITNNDFNEVVIYFISKNKTQHFSEPRYNYFNNRIYFKIYFDFVRDYEKITLRNGKTVNPSKILGYMYNTNEYLHRKLDSNNKHKTLNDMVQNCKYFQRKLVELC